MGIATRIRHLERLGRTGECPLCHGEGKLVTCSILEGEEPPEVSGCERCGRARRMLIVWCDESLPGRPTIPGPRLTAAELDALHRYHPPCAAPKASGG